MYVVLVLLGVGCAGPRAAREPTKAVTPPPKPPAPVVRSIGAPIPFCSAYDHIAVEAYWSLLPWRKGERWIRLDGRLPLYAPSNVTPSLRGCTDGSTAKWRGPGEWPPGDEPLDVGCVPLRAVKEIEVSAEFACRLGAGKRTVVARVMVDPEKKGGERLPVEVSALPPTPPEEQNGGAELAVWRSRDELPSWLAPSVPPEFDFERYMLAGPDIPPAWSSGVVILTPDQPPTRMKHVLLIELRHPQTACPPCQGIYIPRREPKRADPLRLWKLATEPGKVFLREHHPYCPPCLAP